MLNFLAHMGSRNKTNPLGGVLVELRGLPIKTTLGLATLAAAAGIQVAKGAIIFSEASIPAHQELGAQYPGALFATAQYNDGTTVINYTYGGVFIGRNDALGLSYLALPAHGLSSPFQSLTSVGFGPGISNPNQLLPNLNLVYRGDFNPAAPNMTPSDLEIYSTTYRAEDAMIRPIASSSPVHGDLLTVVSYGRVSTTGGRLPIYDGMRLGWNTTAQSGAALDVNDAYYTGTYFSATSGIILNGGGNPRDSGAPAYNQAGELVGFVTASTAGALTGNAVYTQSPRTTFIADWAAPGYNEFLTPYAGISAIPEPSCSMLAVGGILAAWGIRRTLTKSRALDSY